MEDPTMTDGPRNRFYAALGEDAELAGALRRLPAAAKTGDWPMAERAVRAAALAAVCRALWCAMRGPLSRPRAARMPQAVSPAAPGHQAGAAA
jgi:hypothetical protein